MIARAFFAFCLLAASANAELITISEGNFDRVNLDASRELLFTGGSIRYLNNVGGLATIDGGRLTGRVTDQISRVTAGGTVRFTGSKWDGQQQLISRSDGLLAPTNTVAFEGIAFRIGVIAGDTSGTVGIEGIMADGSFLNVALFYQGYPRFHHFEIFAHPELATDPNRDGVFDLADLNIVRNNFGQTGDLEAGDIDGDGVVSLGDLNEARNRFGNPFTVPASQSFSGVIPLGNSVPEPSAIALGFICGILAAFFVRIWDRGC